MMCGQLTFELGDTLSNNNLFNITILLKQMRNLPLSGTKRKITNED